MDVSQNKKNKWKGIKVKECQIFTSMARNEKRFTFSKLWFSKLKKIASSSVYGMFQLRHMSLHLKTSCYNLKSEVWGKMMWSFFLMMFCFSDVFFHFKHNSTCFFLSEKMLLHLTQVLGKKMVLYFYHEIEIFKNVFTFSSNKFYHTL